MGLRRFTVSTGVGSAVWNGALIGIGYALGSNWQNAQSHNSLLPVLGVRHSWPEA